MPKKRLGNMFDTAADRYLVTANSTLDKNGRLVMGRGAALTARKLNPALPAVFGRELRTKFPDQNLWRGNLLVSPFGLIMAANFGAFQVKFDWEQRALLGLIQFSVERLCDYCQAHPEEQISLNYPGIGYGKLTKELVAPLLAPLPEQVTIWELPNANQQIRTEVY